MITYKVDVIWASGPTQGMVVANMSWATTTGVDVVFGTIAVVCAVIMWIMTRRPVPKGLRLPPGPRGKPIIGNAGDMPKHHDWETYTRWAKEYGDLVHIKVFGQHIVFANSIDVAHDLFESRSSLYSDRVHLTMLEELAGWDWPISSLPYGERWRRHRRTFNQHFHPTAVIAYQDIQSKHARDLLQRFCKSPDFFTHFHHFGGAVIMEIIYGIKVLPAGDPYIEIVEKAVTAAVGAAKPGSFLVDTLPILKYVPEWMPGAGFQKKARILKAQGEEMTTMPFMAVKHALSAGTATPSFTAALLEELSSQTDSPPDAENVIRYTAAQAYAAAVDTTASALANFVLAMVVYPDAQRKAQAELDSVLGPGRLPTFEDRPHLPYINALCKEVFRWRPVTPIGVPHRLTHDDVYGEYFIPKGSMIIGNVWAMLHDEKVFGPQPEEFIPERFLEPGVRDPTVSFGFGRRICPGRHKADNSVFIVAASMLTVFDISCARDDNGNEIPVEPLIKSGIIAQPQPFRCHVKPRSGPAESLIWDI